MSIKHKNFQSKPNPFPTHTPSESQIRATKVNLPSALCSLVVTILCIAALTINIVAPQQALATDEELTSISTATVTPSYSHPETGDIIDSGGEDSAVLGQSMVEGATYSAALVEVDENGSTWVTLRFLLADQLSVLSIFYALPDANDNFIETSVVQMQENTEDNTADYRFEVPSTDCILQINLDVEPMGRSVAYYATLSDLVDSNTDGFVESVTAGLPITTEGDTETEEPESSEAEESNNAATANNSGISTPLVIGIIAAIIVLCIVGYIVWRKQKRPEGIHARNQSSDDQNNDQETPLPPNK